MRLASLGAGVGEHAESEKSSEKEGQAGEGLGRPDREGGEIVATEPGGGVLQNEEERAMVSGVG